MKPSSGFPTKNSTAALLHSVVVTLLMAHLWALGTPEETGDAQQGRTVKYFRTHLTRTDILGDEIDSLEAEKFNHFRAIYDQQGELIRIEFVPLDRKATLRIRKRNLFPKPRPPFRYFESWNLHTRELNDEMAETKLDGRSFFRATFLDSTHVKTVEYFRKRNRLLWTYYVNWDRKRKDSTVSVVFSTRRPLTVLDPHLFHPTLSEMKQGWIAEFKHNRLGKPLEVTVRDPLGNLYYFYKFKYRFEVVGDTLNPVNYRITTSEYYRADSTLMGSHQLTFTEENRLWKKDYFDAQGNPTESIEYDYDPARKEVTVLIRDPKGNILHRQVLSK